MQKLAQDLVRGDKLVLRGEVVTVTGRKAYWNATTADYTVRVRDARGAGINIGLSGPIDLV